MNTFEDLRAVARDRRRDGAVVAQRPRRIASRSRWARAASARPSSPTRTGRRESQEARPHPDVLPSTPGGGETQQLITPTARRPAWPPDTSWARSAPMPRAPIRVIGSTFTGGGPSCSGTSGQFTDQESAGHRRQDRGLFDQSFFDAIPRFWRCKNHAAQLYPDRGRTGNIDAGDERPYDVGTGAH